MQRETDDRLLDDLLRRAAAAQRLRLERALVPIGLTVTQFVLLREIASEGAMSGAELARVESLTPQTTSVVLRNLSAKDAICVRFAESDGRTRRFELTHIGRSLLLDGAELTRARIAALRLGAPDASLLPVRKFLESVSAIVG